MTPTKADLRIQQSILDGLAAEGIRPHMIVKKGIASRTPRWTPEERVEIAKAAREGAKRLTVVAKVALRGAR